MRISVYIFAALTLSAAPAFAQNVDFGADSSQWANDGECDDPRFTGPGMTTTTLLDADIRGDATDCKTAFDAGRISLIDGGAAEPPAVPVPTDVPAVPVMSAAINFGDDKGDWPKDGECDDRRFYGSAMASNLSWQFVGHDATDCQAALNAGSIALWNETASLAATQCSAIDFGDDTGTYSNDSECDDVRFEGRGAASVMNLENLGKDAADCSVQCNFGIISLRDY